MSALRSVLDAYRHAAVTEREKGTYFEELTVAYLRNEPAYRELYRDVAVRRVGEGAGTRPRDTGIDLVAETVTGEVHAIQCKLYAPDHRVQKSDIDSFFTASGKKPFTRRIIVATTNLWSEHAEDALRDQQPPVTRSTCRRWRTASSIGPSSSRARASSSGRRRRPGRTRATR